MTTPAAERIDLLLAVREHAGPEAEDLESEAVTLERRAAECRNRAAALRALQRVVGS